MKDKNPIPIFVNFFEFEDAFFFCNTHININTHTRKTKTDVSYKKSNCIYQNFQAVLNANINFQGVLTKNKQTKTQIKIQKL